MKGPGLEARAAGVDAIVSCGDLPFAYLEYLVTFLGVPLFYVLGNHDPPSGSGKYPRGCVPLDRRVAEFGDFALVGFSGCRWYSGGPNQYTERQLVRRSRVPSLRLSLGNALGRGRPAIFVSHAAPLGVGDADDTCHRGFGAFVNLLERHSPVLWLHGHVHLYGGGEENASGDLEFGSTRVVNAYGYRILTV